MDFIHHCTALVPVPYLNLAFSIFRSIWASIQAVKESTEQLRILTSCIAQLLKTLNEEYSAGRLVKDETSEALADLIECAFH